ncbi:peptide chain release factor N(5)-glutamine methyltransferase [Sporolituus thermophilus]|uniref:Release factor glutamine methyltransferase n=1 Tax=Sporolituus thermophilus DSM 23256 TaxID=1123285 RepID=A0A1G7HJG1_9FIRM|nr:peptide chain release factor N(5)-glutamine methyltransferase [Sporolituus thermophilus]SDF00610.1 [protein release factor]-glutamine N5-methyltransferase [Sporolituus thermophilus DSM 23256]
MNAKEHKTWTIGAILNWTGQYFRDKGVATPRLDAEVLLSHILGRDRLYLYLNYDQPLEPAELAAFREAVKQRALRVPVAYITGHKEFMGLDFIVTSDVLVPRPDTEVLVEAALARLAGVSAPVILDLGVGSGAIIVSLLHRLKAATGVGVDISPGALKVAAANAQKHGVAARLALKQGDLFAPVAGRTFHAIVSNPPYIPDGDLAGLEPEVRHEPRTALAGGADGLDFYRRIVAGAPGHLNEGGFLAVEVGRGQAAAVAGLAAMSGLGVEAVIRDYAGIERVVIMRRDR